ncbi:acyl-CoA dehydrogenase family protein [Actinomadura madurae]|uniref:acyl-CoA dehydrogenase family protein n=2 Tax=Actinomadura madurae TaxID=1993 RepID=UPI0020D20B4E|nr:acyl-CoA dehydrogenase family protein [Actinomadura madurae]MCQ0003534.1 acyl-CoA dehydrogenase family protein [Actinomadura madurae]MCQ0021105.1 acyl-CoA dehydrogenase family protein [Actinomadura madurae]
MTSPEALNERIDDFLRAYPVSRTDDRRFREARFDAGLAMVHFDPGLGGLGLAPSLQPMVDARFREAGCADWRDRNLIGLGMAAPTIHAHGTAAQKRLLRPLFSGEHVWCQLFSEPGAGSDLAAMATRAVRDGDSWIVSGQKVWTSLGHVARYGLLLARTDPTLPKHRGLTYFLLDMSLPGVDVRALRQLTGEAEFNEVYLTDVRVPDTARLGAVGSGWAVALTTLSNERSTLGDVVADRGTGPIGQAVALYRQAIDGGGYVEPELHDRLIRLWCRTETNRLMSAHMGRSRSDLAAGPDGSVVKLQMAELNQAVYDLCVDLMGLDGVLYDSFALTRPGHSTVHGSSDPRRAFLRSLANSIEGGTSEIQRTVIGERVLGLPPEPRVDKDRPWTDVPRG